MRPPIFADNRGDITAHASADDAESYVEAIDVLNNEYVFYDSEGSLLEPDVVERPSAFRVGRIRLRERSDPQQQPEELATRLRRILLSIGKAKTGLEPEWLLQATLSDLVEKASPLLAPK